MRYLNGTLDFKLCLGGKDIVLNGFCVADWVGDANDQQSTTWYVIFVGVGVISWKYKKITNHCIVYDGGGIYMTTNHCTKETIWFWQLLADVRYVQEEPTSIMCDNQGCIALAKNPTHHSRTKYIDVEHHFIIKKLKNQKIGLKYYPIVATLVSPLINFGHFYF